MQSIRYEPDLFGRQYQYQGGCHETGTDREGRYQWRALPRHKATITATGADTIRYVWTTGTALPGYGWQTITSGTQLTENREEPQARHKNGICMCFATAASGASTHQYKEFTFMNPAITDVSVRAGGATSSADAADCGSLANISWCSMRASRVQGQRLPLTDQKGSEKYYILQWFSQSVCHRKWKLYRYADGYLWNVISKTIEVRKIDSKNRTGPLAAAAAPRGGRGIK